VNIRDLEAIAKIVKEEIFVNILYKKAHVEHVEEVDFVLMIGEKNNAKIATYHYIWFTFRKVAQTLKKIFFSQKIN